MTTIQCPECDAWCFHPFDRAERDVGEDFICPECRCEFTMTMTINVTKNGFKLEGR